MAIVSRLNFTCVEAVPNNVNYGHRVSAVIVGALLLYVEREANNEFKDSKAIVRVMLKTAGIIGYQYNTWRTLRCNCCRRCLLRVALLLHLLVGVCVFLTLATTYLLINIQT